MTIFLVIIFLLTLTDCQPQNNFSIRGQLPDRGNDGEKIYLVPLQNPAHERIDSTMIRNGCFRFEGYAEEPGIYILRTRPLLRLKLQELLVVKEPGQLTVKIGKNSSVCGTRLNDSLQGWKEKKISYDSLFYALKREYKTAAPTDRKQISRKADSLKARIVGFHFDFVKHNQDNVVGKMVNQMMENSFSPEQKEALSLRR